MTTPITRNKVPLTLTNSNALEILAVFRRAAVSVGWSQLAAMKSVVEAMSGGYRHLHKILARRSEKTWDVLMCFHPQAAPNGGAKRPDTYLHARPAPPPAQQKAL